MGYLPSAEVTNARYLPPLSMGRFYFPKKKFSWGDKLFLRNLWEGFLNDETNDQIMLRVGGGWGVVS